MPHRTEYPEPPTRRSSALTKLAARTWPRARVLYKRESRAVPATEPGGRLYYLERPPVTEYTVVYLGDSPEAAETKLRAFAAAVDLDAIAERTARTIKAAEPGDDAW